MKAKTIFILSALGLLLLFVIGVLTYSSSQEQEASELAAANRESLLRMHSPTLGPAGAAVTIVEFFDPACETCGAFYPLVKQLLAAHPERLRLVLRYAPFHNGSDKVVALLEAARKQGRFWPVLERLLKTQAAWSPSHQPQFELALGQLDGLDLNLEQLAFDMTAPEIAQVIKQDLADAQALNVSQTPEFFVNGRPLPSFGFEQLEKLLAQELGKVR